MTADERISRLLEEVRDEINRLDRVARDIAATGSALAPGCSSLTRMGIAGYLHAYYTGCETILARIARVAGDMPKGEGWHKALLIESTAPLPGSRPPVLTPQVATALLLLLQFRHFFRATYGVELDVEKLEAHVASIPETHRLFQADLAAFLDAMEMGD